MPKDEFDVQDPFQLQGVALLAGEDTTGDMAECFVEEFVRLGYSAGKILALFADPHYLGPHLALCRRGEPFVREVIAEAFLRRGKPVSWEETAGRPGEDSSHTTAPEMREEDVSCGAVSRAAAAAQEPAAPPAAASSTAASTTATDPMGGPIPPWRR